MRKVLLILFLLQAQLFALKPPELTPLEAVSMLNQIMESHVSCKTLTPPVVKRALEHYLLELDPAKIYLMESEVENWINPTEAFLEQVTSELKKANFAAFSAMHEQMVAAIKRREGLEKQIEELALEEKTTIEELQDLSWAKDEEELKSRLFKIKSLQYTAAQELEAPAREKALARINKRRQAREEDLATTHPRDREKLVLAHVLKAFASSFDAHTAYFTPAEAAQFLIQVQQRLFGIGVQLRDDLNGFTIVKIIEGGPASGTALKVNDRIIAIDAEPVVGLEIMEMVELIRGQEGTKVTLTVLRQEEEGGKEEKLKIELERGEVLIQEARVVAKTIPFGDGVIAHIALHAFYQDPQHCSSADIYEEIHKIQKEAPLKGVVLDLRYNSGGVLPQAVAVTGLFITKGIVCSIKDNEGSIEHLREIDGKTAYDGPLIVLTSKASASASEIVAQTLQDYGRAIVVGDAHTYGKGTFQTFSLDAAHDAKINPKGEFKVTRGKYYTVSGKSPQLMGVVPDIIVPGFYSEAEIGEQHAKYPLDNDAISENFNDDLADIPAPQRDQISWLYRFNLQPKMRTYTRHLPSLQKNSTQRLSADNFYQAFLTELKSDKPETAKFEVFSKNDPQLNEAINIMKDLIVLMK